MMSPDAHTDDLTRFTRALALGDLIDRIYHDECERRKVRVSELRSMIAAGWSPLELLYSMTPLVRGSVH